MFNVARMLSRFSPGADRGNVVPYDVRKEWAKRKLIREHEDTALATLLSDKYARGLCLSRADWSDAVNTLCRENPAKRRKENDGSDVRNGNKIP